MLADVNDCNRRNGEINTLIRMYYNFQPFQTVLFKKFNFCDFQNKIPRFTRNSYEQRHQFIKCRNIIPQEPFSKLTRKLYKNISIMSLPKHQTLNAKAGSSTKRKLHNLKFSV